MRSKFIQSVSVDWERVPADSYLRSIPAISSLETLRFDAPLTFLVGENGTGKSTLIEAIAVSYGFNPEGGTRNYTFSTRDSHSELHRALRISRGAKRPAFGYFLRAESFYNVATAEEGYADADHPSRQYHSQSHGEGFLDLAMSIMRPGGLYIFDEPEAALSPQRQLSLLLRMHQCAKDGAQYIVASHSPILLGTPGAALYSFDGEEIQSVEYEQTDSYRIMKLFMENRDRLLHSMLEED